MLAMGEGRDQLPDHEPLCFVLLIPWPLLSPSKCHCCCLICRKNDLKRRNSEENLNERRGVRETMRSRAQHRAVKGDTIARNDAETTVAQRNEARAPMISA